MRIITDGKKYAVARKRWVFTEVLSPNRYWWKINTMEAKDFGCWTDLETAKNRLNAYKKRKWWTYGS